MSKEGGIKYEISTKTNLYIVNSLEHSILNIVLLIERALKTKKTTTNTVV
ncbi:hypothetical protein ANABIO4_40880 [Bacillus subtilis]|nr:hypothetical protein ANABIO4_40880 [Bacillus subtilis]